MNKFIFISNWTQGKGLSGGDKIWIEFAKVWKNKFSIIILGSEEAITIAKRHGLDEVKFIKISRKINNHSNLSIFSLTKNLIFRTIQAFQYLRNNFKIISEACYVYSTSDFWPDSISAFYIKFKKPKIVWIAGFYLFAPKPWQKYSPYKGMYFLKGLLYYLIQFPIYWIIKKYANIVFITSTPDIKKFVTKKRKIDRIIVIRGGVDTESSKKYFNNTTSIIPIEKRRYDACFIGRLHPQKGVLELINIWKLVCKEIPSAKLAIIGDGPLEDRVRQKIKDNNLGQNVELLGFKDGEKKYNIFKESKIVVHPAIYDSGGMAASEAMAWGLPGVSFDLESLKTYYPKGMLKTKCFDLQEFANNIIRLLTNKNLYNKLSKEGLTYIQKEWDWRKRAERVLKKIL